MKSPAAGGVDNRDITVVITCFNYGEYLDEAVRSALNQAGGAPHVIVVDDGSTDSATLTVLEKLPGQVELIRQSNQGVSSARNNGLVRATTAFVLVLDADDRLAPGALSAMCAPLIENPDVGYAYGSTRFFGEWEGLLRFPPFDPYRLLYRHIVGLSALMRREVVLDTGGFDPSFDNYADWEFWLHALECGWRGVQVDGVTLEYRRHGAAMSIEDRHAYRGVFARIRRKHAKLYGDRSELARQSDLGPIGRFEYRFFWGLRPMPAVLERQLQALHWRPRTQG